MSSYTAYLTARLREFQDRAGPITLSDVRGAGVSRALIREYLKSRDWSTLARDTGDATNEPWSKGPPEWTHDDHAVIAIDHCECVISGLATREGRSPWAVLDDVAALGPPREIHHEGEIVASIQGSTVFASSMWRDRCPVKNADVAAVGVTWEKIGAWCASAGWASRPMSMGLEWSYRRPEYTPANERAWERGGVFSLWYGADICAAVMSCASSIDVDRWDFLAVLAGLQSGEDLCPLLA